MKTILVPLDGSALAEQILPYVRLMAPVLGAQVRLFHAIPDWELGDVFENIAMYGGRGMTMVPQESDRRSMDSLRTQAKDYLTTQAARLREAGLDVETEVRFGPPAELIVEAAANTSAALVALVTHGYSGLRRWTLGSVTDKVAHATTMPLFVVRSREQPLAEVPPIKRIIVPLDGSELARQALPLVAELAIRMQAALFPLTVVVPPIGEAPERIGAYETNDEAMAPLRAGLIEEIGGVDAALKAHQVPVTPLVAHGFAAETIVEEAARRQADLVVMATHGRSGLKRWALGSVADKVLHAATAPLILVRASAGAA